MGHYDVTADGAPDIADMEYLENPKSSLKLYRTQQSYCKRGRLDMEVGDGVGGSAKPQREVFQARLTRRGWLLNVYELRSHTVTRPNDCNIPSFPVTRCGCVTKL